MGRCYRGDLKGDLWFLMNSSVVDYYKEGVELFLNIHTDEKLTSFELKELSEEELKGFDSTPSLRSYHFSDPQEIIPKLKAKIEEAKAICANYQELYTDFTQELCDEVESCDFFTFLGHLADSLHLIEGKNLMWDYIGKIEDCLFELQYNTLDEKGVTPQTFGEILFGLKILHCLNEEGVCVFEVEC